MLSEKRKNGFKKPKERTMEISRERKKAKSINFRHILKGKKNEKKKKSVHAQEIKSFASLYGPIGADVTLHL